MHVHACFRCELDSRLKIRESIESPFLNRLSQSGPLSNKIDIWDIRGQMTIKNEVRSAYITLPLTPKWAIVRKRSVQYIRRLVTKPATSSGYWDQEVSVRFIFFLGSISLEKNFSMTLALDNKYYKLINSYKL